MKIISNYLKLLPLLAMVFMIQSCSDDDNVEGPTVMATTVVDVATSSNDFSILVSALQRANLVTTLESTGPFTVFAPTNDAFVNVLSELMITSLTDLDEATVEAVLGIHVIAGVNVTSDELTTGTQATLGGTIDIDATALTITDPNDRVINIVPALINVQGTNGVVHVVDRVIRP